MTNPTAADLLALLRRAELRDREALTESGADALGAMIEAEDRRAWAAAFGGANSDGARDELRSQADSLRHNDLEARRMLGDTLSEAEEAERLDLASRRTPGGYYKPAEAGE